MFLSFETLLVAHIITGIICLICGVIAMSSRKKRGVHTLFGELYHASFVIVFLTSVIMSIMHWQESAYLFYVGVFSYGLALIGYLARKLRWKNWLISHIGGMLGSYIGIVTATIVVNVPNIPYINELPSLVFWILPTLIGTPFIFKIGNNYKQKKIRVSPQV